MVQDGLEVVVLAVAQLALNQSAGLVLVGDREKALGLEIGLVDLLDGVVADSLLAGDDQCVLGGHQLATADRTPVSAEEHRARDEKRRRFLVEDQRAVRLTLLGRVLGDEFFVEGPIVGEPQRHPKARQQYR